uniref:hypothetical protein n=1 Tax=Escherichia coli TaxID=562 RepID=UPI00196452B2
LTYQWYSNTSNSNTGGTLIGGATASSYTPSSATVGTTYYYVVVGSDCGSDVSSSAVGVTITENTAIATQPVGASYCQSASVTDLSVSATGTGT